ncbi:MAG: hypothetical protein ACI86H_002047, partial [bacterium]
KRNSNCFNRFAEASPVLRRFPVCFAIGYNRII